MLQTRYFNLSHGLAHQHEHTMFSILLTSEDYCAGCREWLAAHAALTPYCVSPAVLAGALAGGGRWVLGA